jgi:hypothetical protein
MICAVRSWDAADREHRANPAVFFKGASCVEFGNLRASSWAAVLNSLHKQTAIEHRRLAELQSGNDKEPERK